MWAMCSCSEGFRGKFPEFSAPEFRRSGQRRSGQEIEAGSFVFPHSHNIQTPAVMYGAHFPAILVIIRSVSFPFS